MSKNLQTNSVIIAFAALVALASTTIAAGKSYPAGIVRLFEVYTDVPENSPAWVNPNLDGVRLRPNWNNVQQTGPTTYDWTAVDKVFGLAADHGKFVGMSVAAGICTPQWVYNAGAIKYKLQDGSGNSMAIPWDGPFLGAWIPFINAMGHRYDGNPALSYIVISGLGQYIETYLAQTVADQNALTALGGTTAWVAAAKQVISVYANAFPTTPFFITASSPFSNTDGVVALQQVIDWGVAAYPGRFGIMSAGLSAHSDTGYYPNLAIYNYSVTQPVGFQMLCSASSNPQRLGGTLNQALTAGVRLKAKFVELYQNDADKAANQNVLKIQGDALYRNAFP